MFTITRSIALFVVLCGFCCLPAQAQCDNTWEPGPLSAPIAGADGAIYAIIAWSLPAQPSMLIVAGDFTHIGGIAANRIASWDGQVWHALDIGFTTPVYSLTVYNFSLVAGGEGFIAAWGGSTWTYLGAPLPTFNGGHYHNVYALAIYNSDLYAGGDFTYINTTSGTASDLWKYNGSAWSPVPAGVGTSVDALQVFDDDGAGPHVPLLYIGGESTITSLRKWDGATATAIDGPHADTLNHAGSIFTMTVVNPIGPMAGGLIVGGSFLYLANGSGGNSTANSLARYDGSSWSTIGGGVGVFPNVGSVSAVRAFGRDLYVGGSFSTAGNGAVTAANIARWNGSQWFAVGGGISGSVKEMREFNGSLYVGGSFGSVSGGGVSAADIARWSGAAWSNLAESFSINALARLGSRVFIGGSFSQHTGPTPSLQTNRYNLETWDGVDTGGIGPGPNGTVNALVTYTTGSGGLTNNVIVAGGAFTSVGPDQSGFSIAVNRVAAYVEPSLTLPYWDYMGNGFNGDVKALERFNGNTVAGGTFTASGATSVLRLAKYTGSPASWQPLTSPDPGLNGTVWALKSFAADLGGLDSYLVMGGDFTSAPGSGVAANRILTRKENPVVGQSAWQAMGNGFSNGAVYAIERYGSGLNARTYAGGSFTASGAVTVNRIARLGSGGWEVVGNGTGFNAAVYALKSAGGYLFAAGGFTSVDGIAVNHVAKWNGTAWSDASGGTNDIVWALTPYQTELIAGGVFTSVESGTLPSPGMARLKISGLPWFTEQPVGETIACGDHQTYFELTAADGYADLTYQWRKDSVPINDGPTGNGSFYSGTHTQFLDIFDAKTPDQGSYDCVVTNACGSVTSSAAALTITNNCPACIGDANLDHVVNVNDLLLVITNWGACPPPAVDYCFADVAPVPPDGQVNVNDLLAVITHWGACP